MSVEPAPGDDASRAREHAVVLARRRRTRWIRGALLALLVGCPAWAHWAEPRWIELTRHRVGPDGAPLGPDAPAPVGSVVVALHLTDLHISEVGGRERRVLELVGETRPDIILITGDTVTALDGDEAGPVTAFLAALVALRPPLGVWACPGNHEDWSGPAAAACYRDAGVRLLRDESVSLLGGRLALHGLASWKRPANLALATPAFDIVLCHYPAILPRVSAPGLELVLAGHTHGGQVCFPPGHALVTPYQSGEYVAGWYEHEGTHLYVSRGVGMSGVPFRFGCRPEVALLRIELGPG